MQALADQSLHDLLEQVADRRPAPGGGSSSAWACALGAGLVEMAAAFAKQEAVRGRAAELRGRALELAERDLHSYVPVLEAQRLPSEDAQRAARLDAARSEAAQAPLAVAEAAAEVAELGAELARDGNPSLEGDAITGTLLAEAAARAAAELVDINLEERPDDERRATARDLAARAWRAREEALG
jgi:formiminotetrahydrofolate cyclodeaminase